MSSNAKTKYECDSKNTLEGIGPQPFRGVSIFFVLNLNSHSLFCFVNFAIVQANSDHLPTKLEIGVRTDQVISHFMARFAIEKEFIGKDVISQIS